MSITGTDIDRMTDAWAIRFDDYDPRDEGRREAIFALGNGMFASRAAAVGWKWRQVIIHAGRRHLLEPGEEISFDCARLASS